jgi:hypothetical protein
MKRAKVQNKVFKGFKLQPRLIALLEKEAAKTNRTQTKVLEMALSAWLTIKH